MILVLPPYLRGARWTYPGADYPHGFHAFWVDLKTPATGRAVHSFVLPFLPG